MNTEKKEITYTNKIHVSCSGKEIPYDHPTIYLEIEKEEGKVECPYCSNVFVLRG